MPRAEQVREELPMEAGGTWFSVQKPGPGEPKRIEVKAICAYAGKEERDGRTRRREAFHHACVGTVEEAWNQAISQMGRTFDLSEPKRVRLEADGEPWCRDAERYLPKAEVTVHLDPFHVNRAVLACFFEPRRGLGGDPDAR